MTRTALETIGVVVGILGGAGALVTVWVKLNAQIAVLQDRSDHGSQVTTQSDQSDDRDDLVDELRRQARRNEDRIEQLESALDREREARERERRQYSEQIDLLKSQVAELRTQLGR